MACLHRRVALTALARTTLASVALLGIVTADVAAVQAAAPRRAPAARAVRGPVYGGGFASAYQRAGRPRVVVFWNRELSEETGTSYSGVVRGHSEQRTGFDGDELYTTNDTEVRAGVERNDLQRRSSEFTERTDWKFESTFLSGLAQSGVNVVDRTMIVRRSGRKAGNTPNQQAIEMDALQGYADILIEVLQTGDDGAPSGVSFKVTAKRISNGRILAAFVTDGQPPVSTARRWVAGPNGYERASPEAPTMGGIARQLVNETLDALGAGLG